jgi:hypothetical protein
MTVLHTGSTKKFSANWGNIFSGDSAKADKKAESAGKSKAKSAQPKPVKSQAKKPATAKKAKPKK